jgi:cytochrome P450
MDKVDWDPGARQSAPERMAQMDETRRRCPVAFSDRNGGSYDVMKYEDLTRIALDPQTFCNSGQPRYSRPLPPLEYDPPEHTAYRALLQRFFAPPRIRVLEPIVREAARTLLAPLLANGGGDFASDFSYPLPVFGLCALLGIPSGDWNEIKAWSEHTLHADSSNPEERKLAVAGHERILDYARAIIADRRANPRSPEDDITSALLAARIDERPLDDDLMAHTLRIFISAGHNSTTSAIGNCLLYLAQNPADQQRLREEPARIAPAVEEVLRLDTPVQEMPRWTTREVEVRGRRLPAGARIGMFWASGNRDEEVFPNAGTYDIDRKPNRHLTFGHGVHMCIGAPMARMEIRVALEELLAGAKSFVIAGVVERPPFHRMGVVALPLQTEKA